MFTKSLAALGMALAFSTIAFAHDSAHEEKTVKIAAPWEITSFDLAISGYVIQKLEIMENLVDADENGVLRPGLATDWAASEDAMTWRFTLRNNVTFHDGTAFNAGTALTALTRAWKQPGVLSKAPIKSITAEDNVIIFEMEKAFAALPALLAHATTIIPAAASFDEAGAPVAFVGTGPFKVSAYTPPQSIDLERYDNYWGKKAKIAKAGYLAAGRAETRALLAETGDANLVFTFDPAGFNGLQAVDSVETIAVPIPRVVTLKVNAGHAFFADPKARQALSLAINRQAIATSITRFPEAAASQLFPPALNSWHNTDLPKLEYDMEKAKMLLAELGWQKGEDGILVKNGERFAIQLRTFPDRPELPLIATVLQASWKEIGIELDVSVANYSQIPAGHQDGSLHVALYARNYGLTPDPIGTVLQDFAAGGGDWGAMGWENAQVAQALEEIAAKGDVEKRAKNIALVSSIIQEELPLIPITWYQHTASIDANLEDVIIDPLQRSYGLSTMRWKK